MYRLLLLIIFFTACTQPTSKEPVAAAVDTMAVSVKKAAYVPSKPLDIKFVKIKPYKNEQVKIKPSGFAKTSTFIFDRYDETYHLRKAERGNIYLKGSLTITAASSEKDPPLPGIYAYRYDKETNRFYTIGEFKYEFAKFWSLPWQLCRLRQ